MQIIKEKLDIDETLNKRINNLLKFVNIKSKLINGSIIHISKTNLAVNDMYKDNVIDDNDIEDINLSKEKDDYER